MPLENENTKEVVIKTSHNSFSWGSRQLKGVAAAKALVSCLEQKARAIELDIWWHAPRKRFVVAHGLPASHPVSQCMPKIGYKKNIYVTNRLKLDEALEAVKEGAFKTTNLPLFIFLDIGWLPVNKERFQTLADHLKSTFGDQILTRDQFSFETPLREYMGKIIFIPATEECGVQDFDDISCWSQAKAPFKNLSEPDYQKKKKNITNEDICRIFPHDVLFSGNYNPLPLLYEGVTFPCLDLCTKDKTDVSKLDIVFTDDGIVPIKEAKALIDQHANQQMQNTKPEDKKDQPQESQDAPQTAQEPNQIEQETSNAQGAPVDVEGQSKV